MSGKDFQAVERGAGDPDEDAAAWAFIKAVRAGKEVTELRKEVADLKEQGVVRDREMEVRMRKVEMMVDGLKRSAEEKDDFITELGNNLLEEGARVIRLQGDLELVRELLRGGSDLVHEDGQERFGAMAEPMVDRTWVDDHDATDVGDHGCGDRDPAGAGVGLNAAGADGIRNSAGADGGRNSAGADGGRNAAGAGGGRDSAGADGGRNSAGADGGRNFGGANGGSGSAGANGGRGAAGANGGVRQGRARQSPSRMRGGGGSYRQSPSRMGGGAGGGFRSQDVGDGMCPPCRLGPCYQFVRGGECRFGVLCKFSHACMCETCERTGIYRGNGCWCVSRLQRRNGADC
jgi:hypothetical protein